MQSYRRRVPLTSAALRARRRRRARVATALIVLILIAGIGGIMYLLRAPFLRIQSVTVTGADAQSDGEIAAFTEGQLAGNYHVIIPRNHVFFYSPLAISAAIRAAFPRLKSTEVVPASLTALAVSVSERLPAALWCGPNTANPMPCEFLDSSGAAYASAPFASTTAYVSYYGMLDSTPVPPQYLTPNQFESLRALASALASKAAVGPVASLSVDDAGNATLQFQNDFQILFLLSDAITAGDSVTQRFALALNASPFQLHAIKEFSYLDLRFGNKLYYKLKGDTSIATSSILHP